MAENVYRNQKNFKAALEVLSTSDTEGDVLNDVTDTEPNNRFEGQFQIFIAVYSSDVEFQQRVPAEYDADGMETTAATAWVTIKELDAAGSDVVLMTRNFEYRCNTATAGSNVYLDVQWGAVQ